MADENDNALTKVLANFGVSYPNAPAATPALLAFVNGLGLQLGNAEDTRRVQQGMVESRSADAMDDAGRAAERRKESLTGDLVRRGVLSSGEANTRYARQAEDLAEQRSDIARGKTDAMSALDQAYESTKGGIRTQVLGQVLGTETDQARAAAVSQAQEQSWQRQQDAAAEQYAREKEAQDRIYKLQEDYYRKVTG
jgi:hypothetical protein